MKKRTILPETDESKQIKSLERMVRRADKLAALGTMAAGMAHEIKNPLASIKIMSQLAAKKINDDNFRKKYSEIMPVEIGRIDRIIEGMLGYARTSKQVVKKTDINALIKEALFFFTENMKKNKINAVFVPQGSLKIYADDQQIFQMLLNLIQNAVNSMPNGGQLNISTGKTAKSPLPEESIVISVSDTGCGITKENLSRIFDPFFTLRYGGTGLGLTIVHGIIEAHKGIIDVVSEEGKGTVFSIILPIDPGFEKKESINIEKADKDSRAHRILHRSGQSLQDGA
jgi:signal transduction histidine kinase